MPLQSDKFRSWLPHGFDFESPSQTKSRLNIESRIRQIFNNNSLVEVSPPFFDFANTFSIITRRNHSAARSFEFMGGSGEKLAIRSDLTVQIIKAIANRRLSIEKSAGFCYIQPVFHNHPWGSGINREFIQAGVEWIGPRKNRFEFIMNLAKEIVPDDLSMHILYGDARFIKIISSWFPEKYRKELASLFLNKDTRLLKDLSSKINLPLHRQAILSEVPLLVGSKAEVFDALVNLCSKERKLLDILDLAKKYDDILYDFSLVSELSYYTGPVFEGYINGSHKKILSGGIYDSLYSEFSSENMQACGFGLDLSGLLENI